MTIFEAATTTRTSSITLSTVEFDVLWERLGYGRMPLILNIPSPGKTHEERLHIVNSTVNSLASRGLVTNNQPMDELAIMLDTLDRPTQEIEARLQLDCPVRALVASKNQRGILVVFIDNKITMRSINSAALANEIVSLLPNLPPGHGRSVTIPSLELATAAKNSDTSVKLTDELVRLGIQYSDASALAGMITDVSHSGNFSVITRNRNGQPHRADHVVGFFDTPKGRYLQTRKATPGQVEWTTITPATDQLLVQQINDLLNEVTD